LQGDANGAYKLLRPVFDVHRLAFGEENVHTLRSMHNAESLLPSGRGVLPALDESTETRVRWAKEPVGLNRRADASKLWALNQRWLDARQKGCEHGLQG